MQTALRAGLFVGMLLFSSVSLHWWSPYLSPYSISIAGLIVSLAGAFLLASIPWWGERIIAARDFVLDMGNGLVLGVALWGGVASAAVAWWILDPIPHIPDGFSYLLQAKLFAAGRLWIDSPAFPEFFPSEWTVLHEGRLFSVFPPGWPLILSIGVRLGLPWLVNPLLAILGLWLMWLIWSELFDKRAANGALVLCALSPFLLFLSGSFMSHSASLVASSAFVLAFLRGVERNSLRWGALAGLPICYEILIRPPSGAFLWASVVTFFLIFKRSKSSLRTIACSAFGVAVGIGIYFAYNRAIVGEWFVPPLYLTEPANRFGFGPDIGLDWYSSFPTPGHNPWRALLNLNLNMAIMNNDLFGWPLASLAFVFICLLFGRLDWRHGFCASIIAGSVVGYAGYWYNGGAFGARFYYYLLPYLAILTVEGLRVLQKMLGSQPTRIRGADPRSVVSTLVLLFVLYSIFLYIPKVSQIPYWNLRNISFAQYSELQGLAEPGDLIFIKAVSSERYAPAFLMNDLNIEEGSTIYAWDRGEVENQRLIRLYPDRRVRYWQYEERKKGDRRNVPILFDPLRWLRSIKEIVVPN